MTKNKKLILLGLLLTVLVISIVAFIKTRKFGIPEQAESELKVATDPSFVELEGALLEGFPEFPVYPEAELVGSAEPNGNFAETEGYRAKWEAHGEVSVSEVMDWYQEELSMTGWVVEPPNDAESTGEQVADISNSNFKGYIAIEDEGDEVEIVVDIKKI